MHNARMTRSMAFSLVSGDPSTGRGLNFYIRL
jgi:hypothetical protein